MCKMKIGRSGSFVRDGMSIEVTASTSDDRHQLISRGRSAFNLSLSKHGDILGLFTMSGAMIIDEEWSLGDYMKRNKKGDAKLGIGYVKVLNQ